MVSQSSQEHPSQDCVDGLSKFSSLSVSAQPAGAAAYATQRTAANISSNKSNGARPNGGSSKNPFAAMPREMRNNQLRNNLAAVAGQFKAMSTSPTGAAGMSSPTAGSARTSAEFGTFQQQQPAPYMATTGCQLNVHQTQPTQTAPSSHHAAMNPAAGRPGNSSPPNGVLVPSKGANSCSPTILHALSANPATYPRPPPPNQQQFLQQQYSNTTHQTQVTGPRSTSFDLPLSRTGSDPSAAFEARRSSVDLSPYMAHQMQLQQLQQQQQGTYGMHRGAQLPAAPLPSFHATSDPFPQLLFSSCNSGSFSQQQQMLMMQPLLLGQTGGFSASDPALFTPSMQQQQPQVVMSASASLPPVTVALPVAQQHAAAHTERQLQKLLFNQQMEQVMQQRLLQLSAEY